jgi:aminopeptidase N
VVEDHFRTMSGRVTLRTMSSIAAGPLRLRHGSAQARHALDEVFRAIRSRRVQDRRVSSSNMGAMENKGLNIFNDNTCWRHGRLTDADFANIERPRARVFSQLTGNRITCRDRFQLWLSSVDGLSRPGVHRRPALAAGRASATAYAARHPVRRDAGSSSSRAAGVHHEINNFYTTTVYEKAPRLCACPHAARPREFPQRHGPHFTRRGGGDRRAVRAELADAAQVDLTQFVVVFVPARSRWSPPVATMRGETYRLEIAQTVPPTPGQPNKQPMAIARARAGRADGELPLVAGQQVERGVVARPRRADVRVRRGRAALMLAQSDFRRRSS